VSAAPAIPAITARRETAPFLPAFLNSVIVVPICSLLLRRSPRSPFGNRHRLHPESFRILFLGRPDGTAQKACHIKDTKSTDNESILF
jgi:hypothetical protein